ncbi:MAG: hypothetical protein RRB13_02625 [bacterium]|nr:hypothetical protein [bacterium]
MKLIYPDNITLVDAGPAETLAEYPLGNLTDDHLRRPWKADAGAASELVVNLASAGPANAVALFGLEVEQLTLQVYSDAAMTQLVDSLTVSGKEQELFGESWVHSVWFEFAQQSAAWFKLTLGTANHKTPKIGRVTSGLVSKYVNPKWGYAQGLQDYSTSQRLRNGAKWARAKEVARSPKLTLEIPLKDPTGWDQYHSLIELYQLVQGATPFAILTVEGRSDASGNSLDHRYAHWASFASGSFSATEGGHAFHTIDFTLEENL